MYIILSRKLYIMGSAAPMLRFQGDNNIAIVLPEVHMRACNSHFGGEALPHKILRAVYYWSTLMKDSITFIKKFDQCYRNTDLHHFIA